MLPNIRKLKDLSIDWTITEGYALSSRKGGLFIRVLPKGNQISLSKELADGLNVITWERTNIGLDCERRLIVIKEDQNGLFRVVKASAHTNHFRINVDRLIQEVGLERGKRYKAEIVEGALVIKY